MAWGRSRVRVPLGPQMKIFIVCSKRFFDQIPKIQKKLEDLGHELTFPNTYPATDVEDKYRQLSKEEIEKWRAEMFRMSLDSVIKNDAVLVLNFEKDGVKSYIGGSTFMEMYDAYRMGKKIFLYNEIPEGILADEIEGFGPTVINGDLNRIE